MPAELATTLTATEADRLMQAEALVREFCGWHIAPARTVTVKMVSAGGTALLLPSLEVTAVTAVRDVDGTTPETLTGWKRRRFGILYRSIGWPTDHDIEVDMTHGFAAVPAEVQGVVQAVAHRAVNNPRSQVNPQAGPFRDSNSQTESNQAPALALLDAEKAILGRYRLTRA